MAEVNVSALAAVTPVAQRNPASQGSAQPAEQSGQSSFAQVLKSRSQTQDAAKATPAKARTDKAADAPADKSRTETESTAPVDPAAQAATTVGMDPTLLLAAAAQRLSAQTENNAATLQTTEAGTQNAAPLLAASTAALAARAASLAGKTPANGSASTDALQGEAANRSATSLPAQSDDKSLASQIRSDAETRTETSTVSADDAAEKQLATRSQDKANSFATELANASQNLNVEASPQTTHGVLSAAHNNRAGQTLPQHEVSTPVATRGWAEEVGQKVSWIANRDNGRAELILTPPSLGRVEVSINMNGDQASATFVAASPAAREALQDAMPRLREVLAQSGIQLGQANVNAGNSGQAQSDTSGKRSMSSRFTSSGDSLSGVDAAAGTARSSWIRQGNGMIDTFA